MPKLEIARYAEDDVVFPHAYGIGDFEPQFCSRCGVSLWRGRVHFHEGPVCLTCSHLLFERDELRRNREQAEKGEGPVA